MVDRNENDYRSKQPDLLPASLYRHLLHNEAAGLGRGPPILEPQANVNNILANIITPSA